MCRFNETLTNGLEMVKETLNVGFSAGVQTSIISLSNVFVFRYINCFSASTVAGVGIGHRIDNLMSLPTQGFEAAITTFTSQNIGAKQTDRIKSGIKTGLLVSTGISVGLSIIIYPLAPYLARLFSNDESVINIAVSMMRLIMPFFFTNNVRQVLSGVLRAYKFSSQSMILSLLGMVGLRQLILALTKLRGQTITDVYISYPAGWITAMGLIIVFYLIKRKVFLIKDYKED